MTSAAAMAYAFRKSMEYGMDNIEFKQMDLLNVADLGDIFDIIECGGVLHHMEKPSSFILYNNKLVDTSSSDSIVPVRSSWKHERPFKR